MSADLQSQAVQMPDSGQGPEADAFGAIVQLYGGMVYSTGLRITGDAHHAADVTQETFFHLLQNAGRITGSLGGWLHRVATRRAIDIVRRDRSRRLREQAFAEQSAVETDSWADVSPLVDEALNELDERSRNLIIRHFLQGEKMTAIAAADGVSQPTVSRHLEQALQSLRDRLQRKGVVVAVGILGSLMATSTASAVPAPVMLELGKMSALGAGAIGVAGKAALGAVKLKVAAIVLIAAAGVGGYVAYRCVKPPAQPPAAAVPAPAVQPANAPVRVPMAAAKRAPARAKQGLPVAVGARITKAPASTNRPAARP